MVGVCALEPQNPGGCCRRESTPELGGWVIQDEHGERIGPPRKEQSICEGRRDDSDDFVGPGGEFSSLKEELTSRLRKGRVFHVTLIHKKVTGRTRDFTASLSYITTYASTLHPSLLRITSNLYVEGSHQEIGRRRYDMGELTLVLYAYKDIIIFLTCRKTQCWRATTCGYDSGGLL
jgi:hypothetical protein